MIRALLLVFSLIAAPVFAEQVVADLSRDEVAITANFDGSDILIYGAVKRDTPPEGSPLDVIIAVSGPQKSVSVRKKARRFGIWVNTASVEVDLAPSFYAVASSGILETLLSEVEDLRHAVSIPRAIRSVGAPSDVANTAEFTEALIRIRTGKNLYQQLDSTVTFHDQTLFSTTIDLPANLVEGPYNTRIFLVRDGLVIDEYETIISVNKVGLERWIYDLAHNKPLAYGLLSLFIAIVAGWMASAVFRYIRF